LCNRCKTRASLPLDAIRRLRDTPIWKIDAALKCRSCWKVRYAPPVHMIKLTEARESRLTCEGAGSHAGDFALSNPHFSNLLQQLFS
jgi:hypothetical protein